MFQCYILNLSHPLLPPLCPQVCSLCLHLYSCPASFAVLKALSGIVRENLGLGFLAPHIKLQAKCHSRAHLLAAPGDEWTDWMVHSPEHPGPLGFQTHLSLTA